MFNRKDKEKEFYMQHMDTFTAIGIADPFFTIKTAFFQKGKFGRHSQFFEWELKKGDDIFIEFYDNVTDNKGKVIDIAPMNDNRQLFKLKYNPYFAEEYEVKEGVDNEGKTYKMYIVPTSEMEAVLKDGSNISYSLYEKRLKEQVKEAQSLPRLQQTLVPAMFPDFEDEFAPKKEAEPELQNTEIADALLSEMTIRDLAAIMLMKPVSARPWLNDLIKQSKSEI
jgi:hypothetical protein